MDNLKHYDLLSRLHPLCDIEYETIAEVPDGRYLDSQEVIPGTIVTVGEWVGQAKKIIPNIKCQPCDNCDENADKMCPFKDLLVLPSGKLIDIEEGV